jgi:hypothetical protein
MDRDCADDVAGAGQGEGPGAIPQVDAEAAFVSTAWMTIRPFPVSW